MNFFNIIIGFLLISIVLFLYIVISSGRYKTIEKDTDKGESIKAKAIKKRNNWLKGSIICIVFYYWCILCSIFSTLLVLHIGCYGNLDSPTDKTMVVLLSIVSIFTNVCPYIVDLKKMSKAYRKAFCIIDEAILKDEDLADAITQGENEITIVVE